MYIYIYLHICIYIYMCVCVCVCVCVNFCIYLYIYKCVCVWGGCLKMMCPFFLSKNPFWNQNKTPRFETYPCIYNIFIF